LHIGGCQLQNPITLITTTFEMNFFPTLLNCAHTRTIVWKTPTISAKEAGESEKNNQLDFKSRRKNPVKKSRKLFF